MTRPSPIGFLDFDADATLGCIEIGVLLSTFLFGIFTLQTFSYFRKFPRDSYWLKSLVGVIWFLELGHNITIAYGMYHSTITLYGKPYLLIKFDSLNAVLIIGGLITFSVQSYFALRLYRVLEKPHVSIFCGVLSFARLVCSIATAVEAYSSPSLAAFLFNYSTLLTVLLAGGAFIDIVIAISMCLYLRSQRENARKRTAKLLDGLVKWTIQTGLLTSLSAVALAILFQTLDNFVWMSVYAYLARLYSSSLVSSLNARTKYRRMQSTPTIQSYPHSSHLKGEHVALPKVPMGLPFSEIQLNLSLAPQFAHSGNTSQDTDETMDIGPENLDFELIDRKRTPHWDAVEVV